ncbi:T2SS-translocated chitinase [soil metagenome]
MKPTLQLLLSTLKISIFTVLCGLFQTAHSAEIAPYFYTWGNSTLMQAKQNAGLNSASLAFAITQGSCALDSSINDMLPDIRNFVASGGQLIISFGGERGVYAEIACTDDNQLFNLIEKVILDTGSQRLDFDVEGKQLLNTAATARRTRVLARIQTKYPNLDLSFTLPAWFTGLSVESINLIKSNSAAGVRVRVYNFMTMSWGAANVNSTWVNPATLGQATIVTIRACVNQLVTLFPGKSMAQIYAMVGITPMIGNNADGTFFTLADASTVTQFAKENGVARIGYWAFQRDVAQSYTGQTDLNLYSGVAQSNFQFFKIFVGASSISPAPTQPPATQPSGSVPAWDRNASYAIGSVVKYSDGNNYLAVHATNPGYVPTISTYFWQRSAGPTPPLSACSNKPNWDSKQAYTTGTVVRFSDGLYYIATHTTQAGYTPTISTYFWSPFSCAP